MLKRVVFFLDKKDADKKIEKLLIQLGENRITADWGKTEQLQTGGTEEGAGIIETDNETGTLYITDNADCQKFLKQKKVPVLVYLHEENKGKSFAEAEYAIEQIEEIEAESLELVYRRLTGQPWDILTTKRCKIRESTIKDVDVFYEIYKEPSITYFMENLFEDKAEEIAYMEDYIQKVYGFYGYGMWTVMEQQSGQVIGRAGISWREGYDIPELGFVIAVPYQGKGYAYEVCQAILEYGRREFAFTQYQVLIMEGNKKSERLCYQLGFREDTYVTENGERYKRMVLTMV